MNKDDFINLIECGNIIPAVKNNEQLEVALKTNCKIIFVLYGDIFNIGDISKRIKKENKIGFIHFDLIDGISGRESGVKFVREKTFFDGIISTKSNILKFGKKIGFFTVLRTFLIDSLSFNNILNLKEDSCDAIEILPGIIYKATKEIKANINVPVIVGGLIDTKEEIHLAIENGADAISTTGCNLWKD